MIRLKRVVDIIGATTGLVVLSPLLIGTAVAIKAIDGGPVFYTQPRFGRKRTLFTVYKFRTLKHGTQKRYTAVERNDPRVTKIGAFLRRTSIDELPQLLNVLKGEMSLVGPRPHPVMLDISYQPHIPWLERRYDAKPGLTGLAQVNGSRGMVADVVDMKMRVNYDIEYNQCHTLMDDVNIMFKTILVCFKQTNAY